MKKPVFIALAVAAADQAIKSCIRTMPVGEIFFEIPGLAALTHHVNTGVAFSLFSGQPFVLAVISLGLLCAIYAYAQKKLRLSPAAWTALGCLFGGGIGNLADRVLFSGVTDYILLLFLDFPVFNLADIAITGSIGWLIVLLFSDALEETAEENHGSGC